MLYSFLLKIFQCSTHFFSRTLRDDFNFLITNFPFLCGNIATSPAYGVFVSQLMYYCTACSDYKDLYRYQLLTTTCRWLLQCYQKPKAESMSQNVCGCYHHLIEHYKMTVSGIISKSVGRNCSLFWSTWFHPLMEGTSSFFIYWFCQYLDKRFIGQRFWFWICCAKSCCTDKQWGFPVCNANPFISAWSKGGTVDGKTV